MGTTRLLRRIWSRKVPPEDNGGQGVGVVISDGYSVFLLLTRFSNVINFIKNIYYGEAVPTKSVV